ncbi:hypothetical protein BCR32DRAFT_279377 [Anaeromyces robustus]|uniref:HAM1-like N-terminal domain-containing protein n=1 Tax=Anaeromyces robustus TaxID=1754192 RepID=A0A1Y1X7Y7_9FUNG|nr:hypothetical protein BCR32DRAFT_279377 [Anaeromyces robustus]|eukprot:ORX81845.1 hypothetical protein BCR32DRAFT_279377 [Anaeromyces robustus]
MYLINNNNNNNNNNYNNNNYNNNNNNNNNYNNNNNNNISNDNYNNNSLLYDKKSASFRSHKNRLSRRLSRHSSRRPNSVSSDNSSESYDNKGDINDGKYNKSQLDNSNSNTNNKSSLFLKYFGSKKDGKEPHNYYNPNKNTNIYSNPYLSSNGNYYYNNSSFFPSSSNYNQQDKSNYYDQDQNDLQESSQRPYYYDFTSSSKKDKTLYDSKNNYGNMRSIRHYRSASLSSLNSSHDSQHSKIKIRSKSVDPRPRRRSIFLGGGYYHQAGTLHRSRSMDEQYLDDPRINLNTPSSSSSTTSSSDTSSSLSYNHDQPYYHLSKSEKKRISNDIKNKYKPLPDIVISPSDDPKRVFRDIETIHDPKLKYKDYQKKQKIFNVIQALLDGKLPTNQQLFIFINHIRNSRHLKDYSVHLSAEGKYIFNDWLKFLDIAYLMLQEKNKDESLQKFLYYSRLSTQTSIANNIYYPMVDFIKRKRETRHTPTSNSEIKQAYTEIFRIIHLFLSNNKFRNLISDINQLIKEVMVEIFNKTLTNPDEKIKYHNTNKEENPLKQEHDSFLEEKFDSDNLNKHPFIKDNFNENNNDDNDNNSNDNYIEHPLNFNDYQSMNSLNVKRNVSNNDINNNNSRHSSGSYQNISIHDDGIPPTGDKLTASNNPNPYQNYELDNQNNVMKNNNDFLSSSSDEENDINNFYKNKYRSNKYQYKIKRPLSTNFSDQRRNSVTGLPRSYSLDDPNSFIYDPRLHHRHYNKKNSLNNISDKVQNINKRHSFIGEDTSRQMEDMKNRISEKIPKTKLKMVNRTIKSKFDKDVIYNILKRLQLIIAEIQKEDMYQNVISVLIKIFNDFIKNGMFIMKEVERSMDSITNDTNTTESLRALKNIMENLAQGYSLNRLFYSLNNVHEYIKNDKYKKEYIRKINRYLYKVLKDPQFIQSQEYIDTGMDLLDEGYLTFSEKYSHQEYFQKELEIVLMESSKYLDNLLSDPLTRKFSDNLVQLMKDIFISRNGKFIFKKELFKDIITMSLPIIIQNIRYIPISRLEYEDSNYHIVMEDIFLSSDNFLPNIMEAKIKHSSIIGLRKSINNDFRNYITLNFFEIQADIRDVPFWYHKKKGFPKMTDWGVANLTIGGRGITIMTKFELCKNDPYRIIVPRKIECFVDDLNLEVKRSKYGILYSLGSSMIHSKIRRQLINNIRKNIFDMVDNINEKLLNLRDNYNYNNNFSWLKMIS